MEFNGIKFELEQNGQTSIVSMYDESGYKLGRCHAYFDDCSFNGGTVRAMVIGCVLTQPEGRRGGLARKMFEIITKYIAPICIILILISSVLDVLGIAKI